MEYGKARRLRSWVAEFVLIAAGVSVALAAEASFVARSMDVLGGHLRATRSV